MKKAIFPLLVLVMLACMVMHTEYALAQADLQPVFRDNTYQLTGVAVSKKGRVFINYPLWSGPHKYSVAEVMEDGVAMPYPNIEMNSWRPGQDGSDKWVCVQAVYVDKDDYLYVVDAAAPQMGPVYRASNKVVKINLKTNQIERTYRLNAAAGIHSYINDIRVDTRKQVAYISNSGEGGIIVLDLNTGKARQLLMRDPSVHPDPAFRFVVDGQLLKKKGKPVKINSDGIALSPDGEWLYYKPLSDKRLYRISTDALLNTTLNAKQLSAQIKYLGEIAVTDGMICDKKGNLYLGDIQNYRMVQVTPDLRATTWFRSSDLIWPDSYSISGKYLYLTTSQIQKQPDYNRGVNKRTSPYMVYKVRLP
jgi:sugar lactone lactonase YvrE